MNKLYLRTLAGIEFNIEILILVFLFHFGYITMFVILLISAIMGLIIKLKEIQKEIEE